MPTKYQEVVHKYCIPMSLSSYVAQPSTTPLLENSHEELMEGDSKLND